jgi:hypothetical protein
MREECAFAVDDGEIIDFARKVESVLLNYDRDEDFSRMRLHAAEMVNRDFKMENEAIEVIRVFSGVLQQVAALTPKSVRLNSALLAKQEQSLLKKSLSRVNDRYFHLTRS